MRAKAFRQGGGELKHHGAGIGSCICKSLNHGIISPPFSLAYFSLEPVLFPLHNQTPVQIACWLVFGNEFQMKSWLETQTDSMFLCVCVCVCVCACFGVYKSVIAVCSLHAGTPVLTSFGLYKGMVTCKHTTSWHLTPKGVYFIANSLLRC